MDPTNTTTRVSRLTGGVGGNRRGQGAGPGQQGGLNSTGNQPSLGALHPSADVGPRAKDGEVTHNAAGVFRSGAASGGAATQSPRDSRGTEGAGNGAGAGDVCGQAAEAGGGSDDPPFPRPRFLYLMVVW
jgi:hypothetical protein